MSSCPNHKLSKAAIALNEVIVAAHGNAPFLTRLYGGKEKQLEELVNGKFLQDASRPSETRMKHRGKLVIN